MRKGQKKERSIGAYLQRFLYLGMVLCLWGLLFPGLTTKAQELRAAFTSEYAKPGEALGAEVEGADPENCQFGYQWTVDGREAGTESTYQVTEQDLEKFIQVTITVTGQTEGTCTARMYCSELPVMYVTTEKEIQDKVNYVDGTLSTQRSDSCQDATVYSGDIEIRFRGNSTMGYDKKPYKVKLGKKTNMFGFGKNKHWTLLANYLDGSFMRNSLAYNLSGELDMPYMQSVDVILIMNGEYRGLYQFCEQIRVDQDSDGNRVDIYDWESAAEENADIIAEANGFSKDDTKALEEAMLADLSWATTGSHTYKDVTYKLSDYPEIEVPERTGGYLIELDEYYDEMSKFRSGQLNQPLNIKNPETAGSSAEIMKYAMDYIEAYETAIQDYSFSAWYQGERVSYAQLFDMDSLVDFWLVNELFMNEDAMKKSTYMYKDIEGLFYMGPIWDMDWSSDSGSGDTNHPDTWQTLHFNANEQRRQWYKFIIQDPYFAIKARERYLEIRDTLLEDIVKTGGIMDTKKEYLSGAALADRKRWNRFEGNYEDQVRNLKDFLSERLEWLDDQFATVETLMTSWNTNRLVTGLKADYDQEEGKITFEVPDGTVKAALLINGVFVGETQVTGPEAVISYPEEMAGDATELEAVYCFQGSDEKTASYGYGELPFTPAPVLRTIEVYTEGDGQAGIPGADGMLADTLWAPEGEEVTVRAIPGEGSVFAGWYVDQELVSDREEYVFTVKGNWRLEARFEKKQPEPEEPDPPETEEPETDPPEPETPETGTPETNPPQPLPPQNNQKEESWKLEEARVAPVKNQVYTGKKICPQLKATLGGKTLKEGKDYTVVYKKNRNTGKALAVLRGRGAYTGSKTVSFSIIPRRMGKARGKEVQNRTVKLTWKRDPQATGYQIRYSLNKSFKKGTKTLLIKKNKTVSKKTGRLKAGKKYYVKIRAYKVIDGKKVFGAYSRTNTIRLRK